MFAGFEHITQGDDDDGCAESLFVNVGPKPDASALAPDDKPSPPTPPPLVRATKSPPPSEEFKRRCLEFNQIHTKAHTESEILRISTLPQHLSSGEANPLWLEARLNKFTGSVVGALFGNNPYETPEDAISKLVWKTPFLGNEMTQWGNEHEDDCQAAYALATQTSPSAISNPGLMLSKDFGQFAMSPDGIVPTENRLLEFKCPFRKKWATESQIRENPDLYLRKHVRGSTVGTVPIPHYYFDQITWGMGLLGLSSCDFAVWCPVASAEIEEIGRHGTNCRTVMTPRGTVQITRVAFEQDYYDRMKKEMLRLWNEVYVPACVWRDAECLNQPDLRPTLTI